MIFCSAIKTAREGVFQVALAQRLAGHTSAIGSGE